MELIKNFIDLFIHLDKHLNVIIQNYGVWTYLLLFLIIFCETGLVVTLSFPGILCFSPQAPLQLSVHWKSGGYSFCSASRLLPEIR